MTTAQLSSVFKWIVNNSSDEENELRLFEFARLSDDKFRTVMGVYRQFVKEPGQSAYSEIDHDDTVIIDQPMDMNSEAQQAVPVEIAQVQDIFPPGNVTMRNISRDTMIALNAMSKIERSRELDRLNLNDTDRTRLMNSLWRLRNPDKVRQNSRRSYQRRKEAKTNAQS